MKNIRLLGVKKIYTTILPFILIAFSCKKETAQINGTWQQIDRKPNFYWRITNDSIYNGSKTRIDKYGTEIKIFKTNKRDKILMKLPSGNLTDRYYLQIKHDTLIVELLSDTYSHIFRFKRVK